MAEPMSDEYLEWIDDQLLNGAPGGWKAAMVQDLRAEVARLRENRRADLAVVSELNAAIERVKALHRQVKHQGRSICDRDGGAYPCRTIRALEGATDE